MIFPFEELEEAYPLSDIQSTPKEYGIDFKTGQLDGRIVEGVEAVKVWVWKALQTARYRYFIYSWDYGSEYESLIGQSYSQAFTEAQIESMTEDAILINPYISSIENFEHEYNGNKLIVHFTIATKFGEVNASVRNDDLRVYYE